MWKKLGLICTQTFSCPQLLESKALLEVGNPSGAIEFFSITGTPSSVSLTPPTPSFSPSYLQGATPEENGA